MENQNKQNPDNESWLDDILGKPTQNQEIGPDEQAISSAGLVHPDQLELENILAENWDAEDPAEPQEAVTEPDFSSTQDLPDVQSLTNTQDLPQVQDIADTPLLSDTQFFPGPAEDADAETADPLSAEENTLAEVTDEPVGITEDTETAVASEVPQDEPPVKKRRPRIKKGYGLFGIPHILATFIWMAIIVLIGVSLGRTLWLCCADLMAFGKPSQEVTITITDADTLDSIVTKLSNANLIRYPGLFKTFAELTGKEERISVGTFTLNSHLDYNAMINAMGYNAPAREEVEVMFPEGSNCAQIFKILEENNVCTVEELEQWAAEGELDEYWFLEGVERGDRYCLEGYLAPDTYEFYTNDDPQRVLHKFLNEFDDRFTDLMKEDLEILQERFANALAANGYGEEYIADHKLTLHQVITLASIVNRETANDAESFNIASVFYNRLANMDDYPYLDSDATVYYAIGDYFREKKELTSADLETDSPYNTRVSRGLPPGPICNPDVYSLYAALDPNETNYYYFVFDESQQVHRFSSTYEGHMSIIAELGM